MAFVISLTGCVLLLLCTSTIHSIISFEEEGVHSIADTDIPINASQIILSPNQLTFLTEQDFVGFSELKVVDLSHGQLDHIPDEIFDSNPELERLFLNDNKLTTAPAFNLPNLKELDLSYNDISFLEAGVFNNLNELKVLNLDFNYFNICPTEEVFEGIADSLTSLHLKMVCL